MIPARRSADRAVLVLRALGLGDALTGVPALRGIRRAWPERRLVLAAGSDIGGWLSSLGLVDEILPTSGLQPLTWSPPSVDGDGEHVAVDLHGCGPQSHRIMAATAPRRLVAFRQPAAQHLDGPEWNPEEHEVDRWCRLITSAGGPCGREDLRLGGPGDRTAEILLHPGAAAPARRWPAARWVLVASRLVRSGHSVALTGGPDEVRLCTDIAEAIDDRTGTAGRVTNLAGRLSLAALAERVAAAALLVVGDTGLAHVATAYATPSVLLFGPTPPRWWGPAIDPQLHAVLWHGDVNTPGDPHGTDLDPSLATIEPPEVLDTVERLVNSGVGPALRVRPRLPRQGL